MPAYLMLVTIVFGALAHARAHTHRDMYTHTHTHTHTDAHTNARTLTRLLAPTHSNLSESLLLTIFTFVCLWFVFKHGWKINKWLTNCQDGRPESFCYSVYNVSLKKKSPQSDAKFAQLVQIRKQ